MRIIPVLTPLALHSTSNSSSKLGGAQMG